MMRVVVTGVCGSGKTTLVTRLQALGIEAYNVAQEHSGIRSLWRKKSPDVLVLLDASLEEIRRRRDIPWGEERLILQRERLRDAREHADLYIYTDRFTREQIVDIVLDHIKRRRDNDGSNHCGGSETRA